MDDDEARTIGLRLHRIRKKRDKSLRVVAELAGMSVSTLHRIEHGRRAVTLSEIAALATVLEVPPSELTRLPVPAPANGRTDSTIEAVRLALDAIEADQPGGMVLPVAALREQVVRSRRQRRACRFAEVATDLPALVRTLHTTLATGTDHAELLDLAVHLHVHITRKWLEHAGAPTDLQRRVVFLTRRLAQERDEATTLAVADFSVVDTLRWESFDVAQAALDTITVPPTTADTAGLVGVITQAQANLAAHHGRPGEAAAPLDAAAELAERFGATGEIGSHGFVYAPLDTAIARMWIALEADDPEQAVSTAGTVRPEQHPFPVSQAYYWIVHGRGLAQLRGRRDDAVWALRTAEDIFPTAVRRDPFVRETVTTLLPGAGRDAVGTEIRGLAYRSGLPA